MNLTEVIIIGAGATGSYLAGELAALGHDVKVLEKRAQPGGKTSCTGIVSAACMSLLQPPTGIIQFKANSARLFSPSGHSIRVEREETQAYILDRPALDRHLVNRAENSGARFLFSTTAEDIQCADKYIAVSASNEQGKSSYHSRSLVVACGYPSSLTATAGLGQISDHALGAQTEADCSDIKEVEVYSGNRVAPGFFAWLAPAGAGKAKIGLLCRRNPRPYMENLLQKLENEGKIKLRGHPASYGAIPLKPLAKTCGRRLLVLGDAAGQVKPTTGGGIYFGLLSARIAVTTLHEGLLKDDLSPKQLAPYQQGWHKLLKHELAIDHWAHRFYRRLSDAQMEHIFHIIQHHGIHESLLASPDITFDWHSHVILDVIRHRSLQKALAKLKLGQLPPA